MLCAKTYAMTKTVHNRSNVRRRGGEPLVFTGFHLCPADRTAVDLLSIDRECSLGAVLRDAVREYLERRGLRQSVPPAAGIGHE